MVNWSQGRNIMKIVRTYYAIVQDGAGGYELYIGHKKNRRFCARRKKLSECLALVRLVGMHLETDDDKLRSAA